MKISISIFELVLLALMCIPPVVYLAVLLFIRIVKGENRPRDFFDETDFTDYEFPSPPLALYYIRMSLGMLRHQRRQREREQQQK